MFGSRIPLKTLAAACRSLSTTLNAGIPVHKAFELAAGKTHDSKATRVLQDVAGALKRRMDVTSAVEEHADAFPDLFRDMVRIGEQGGALPEVLDRLASHYENNVRLRKDFLAQIAWPVFQLLAAIFVIALMIFVLGLVAQLRGTQPIDVLGWGLVGFGGAVTWLCYAFGSLALLYFAYQFLVRGLRQGKWLHGVLMKVPVLGHCMQSFAIARFSWAFALTQQTGMPIAQSLEASLRATSNRAFSAAAPRMCALVNSGEDVVTALEVSGLFPRDYVHMVRVGEESGTIPEQLDRLSPQFEDQARRSLSALASALAWLVWLAVAVFIVYVIFTIFFWYLSLYNDVLGDALGK